MKSLTFRSLCFPDAIKARGLENREELPTFFYRDDGCSVWEAIKEWGTLVIGCGQSCSERHVCLTQCLHLCVWENYFNSLLSRLPSGSGSWLMWCRFITAVTTRCRKTRRSRPSSKMCAALECRTWITLVSPHTKSTRNYKWNVSLWHLEQWSPTPGPRTSLYSTHSSTLSTWNLSLIHAQISPNCWNHVRSWSSTWPSLSSPLQHNTHLSTLGRWETRERSPSERLKYKTKCKNNK